MARSIISGGAPVAVTRKLIRNGVAVAVSAALLSGGAWVDVDTPQQQIEPFTIGTRCLFGCVRRFCVGK